ncbi:hypothetical protein Ddye_013705 [Dipteronia dyeriana]|uniref:Uncharacterized protein n=1 Tax=Dipteronia dyeriana TaxID=168575 RepID=A0AAD9X6W0_9ROSI|nr:hypothetical protein Ddye_013705 [Dipteronia dyeriana]
MIFNITSAHPKTIIIYFPNRAWPISLALTFKKDGGGESSKLGLRGMCFQVKKSTFQTQSISGHCSLVVATTNDGGRRTVGDVGVLETTEAGGQSVTSWSSEEVDPPPTVEEANCFTIEIVILVDDVCFFAFPS